MMVNTCIIVKYVYKGFIFKKRLDILKVYECTHKYLTKVAKAYRNYD